MEPDSTTFESSVLDKSSDNDIYLPFTTLPRNLKLYKEIVLKNGEGTLETHIIQRLQDFGLLASSLNCPTSQPTCNVVCKQARVIDRMQWVCDGCGKRQPVRTGSFFFRLQCSILQALQLILAWCEDADLNIAAQHFDVKPKVANSIVERLDEIAIRELKKEKLGGEDAVVLAEMYPDCLNRLSPDTTDHPHIHRILMLADTKYIPTDFRLHVIREDTRKPGFCGEGHFVKIQVEDAMLSLIEPQATLVTGNNVPILEGMTSMHQLQQYCDVDMQHFLTSRIWSQALSLCSASRDLCNNAMVNPCATVVQRYLDTALYRIRYNSDGFYEHILRLIATDYACNTDIPIYIDYAYSTDDIALTLPNT